MINLMKLKIELFRKKFSIYGVANICSLLIVGIGLLLGVKVIQHVIQFYFLIGLMITMFFFLFFEQSLFTNKYQGDGLQYKTFFTSIKKEAIIKYTKYRNITIFLLFYIYLLMPTRLEEIKQFWVLFFVLSFLLYVDLYMKTKMEKGKYLTSIFYLKIMIGIGIAIQLGNIVDFFADKYIPNFIVGIGVLLIVFFYYKIFYWINNKTKEGTSAQFVTLTNQVKYIKQNEDFIMLLRENELFEEILLLIIPNVMIANYYQSIEIFFVVVLAFMAVNIDLYYKVRMNDEGKKHFFYTKQMYEKIKLKNIYKISITLVIPTILVLSFWIPVKTLMLGYLVSSILFIICFWINKKIVQKTGLSLSKEIISLIALSSIGAAGIAMAVETYFVI